MAVSVAADVIGRCDSGRPGMGKGSLISSSHNLEKPERCRLHSCCVRLYRVTS